MKKSPPKIDIDQLKGTIKITDLARQLGIELDRSNKALCLWHNEKTPSLSFNDEKGIYKCFACDKKGDIIDLYKEIKQVETGQAIKELARQQGAYFAPMERLNAPKVKGYHIKKIGKTRGIFCEVYEELICLCGGVDEESEKYLKGRTRGLTDETITRFLLCSVRDYAKIKSQLYHKFNLEALKQAGVFSDNGHLIFYKHKLLIPFLKDGRIVFIQGRRIEEGQPKYLHLKGVSVPMFNTDTLKGLKRGDKVFITEGVFDAMILEQNGYHAVAILGVNNFKPEMAEQFKGLEVVLAFDNDEAGERATKEVAKIFELNGQEVKTKRLPENIKDITDYFIK